MEFNKANRGTAHITLPFIPDEGLVKDLVKSAFGKR
jgi:hypothetical protein